MILAIIGIIAVISGTHKEKGLKGIVDEFFEKMED
jgi:hypothetical protein